MIKKISGLIFLCLISSPRVWAQENEGELTDTLPSAESLMKKVAELQKEQEKEKLNYEKKIEQLSQQIEKLKSKSEAVKSEERAKSLTHLVDSLNAKLQGDSLTFVAQKVKIKELRDSIGLLKNDLKDLEAFRKDFLLKLFKESEDYLKLPYSQIDQKRLVALKDNLMPYSDDKDVAKALGKINEAMAYKADVVILEEGITKPYNADRISAARAIFTKLQAKQKDFSAEQWKEFDDIDKYLSRYKRSVTAFQEIIAKVNEKVKPYSGAQNERARKDCVDDVKTVFLPYEEKEIEKGIKNIPYLRSRFETYRKWATSNPLTKGADIKTIESEIMTLKTTD